MKVTGFNHLSIGSKNLAGSVRFDETVLGMETIPSYNFGFKTKYLRCGDLQLHIFELDSTAFRNPVNELPDGCVEMYLRDPSGNLIEIDRPHLKTARRAGA